MRYYGQFSPPVDEILHQWLGAAIESPGIFVECGAYDGLADSNCKFLEEFFGWEGVNVEASPTIYKKLVVNRPNSFNVWAALSDADGEATFTQSFRNGREIGVGSLLPEAVEAGCLTFTVVVPTLTWASLIEKAGVSRVDLFSLDVEGHEITVLRDMLSSGSVLPKILVVEHGHVGMQPLDNAVASRYDFQTRYLNNSFYRLRE